MNTKGDRLRAEEAAIETKAKARKEDIDKLLLRLQTGLTLMSHLARDIREECEEAIYGRTDPKNSFKRIDSFAKRIMEIAG
jgi:hypothetical protein